MRATVVLLTIPTMWLAAAGLRQESVAELVRQLQSPDHAVDAARHLEDLGPRAREAVPALTKALMENDSHLAIAAAHALGAIGGAALPAAGALIERAAERNAPEYLVPSCRDALVAIGAPTVPIILNRVIEVGQLRLPSGASERERSQAAQAARERAAQYRDALAPVYQYLGAAAVPPLMKALDSPDPDLRYEAVQALGAVRAPAQPALARLRDLSGPQNGPELAEALREAIKRIEADLPRETVPELIRQLESPPEAVSAAVKLEVLGPRAQDAVPALTRAVRDGDDLLAKAAADALAAIGEAALPAAAALTERACDMSAGYVAYVADPCASALAKIGAPAVPVMLNGVIEMGRLRLRSGATELERSSEELAAWDRAQGCRTALGGAYRGLGAAALPPLLKALESPDRDLRYEAVTALGYVGWPAQPALPRLRALLKQQHDQEFDEALREAIARIEKG